MGAVVIGHVVKKPDHPADRPAEQLPADRPKTADEQVQAAVEALVAQPVAYKAAGLLMARYNVSRRTATRWLARAKQELGQFRNEALSTLRDTLVFKYLALIEACERRSDRKVALSALDSLAALVGKHAIESAGQQAPSRITFYVVDKKGRRPLDPGYAPDDDEDGTLEGPGETAARA